MHLLIRARRVAVSVLALALSGCFPNVSDVEIETREVVIQARDDEGAGVAGVAIEWWPEGLDNVERNAAGETNAEGRLEFDVSLWSEITLTATPPATHSVAPTQSNPVDVLLSGRTTVTMSFVRK